MSDSEDEKVLDEEFSDILPRLLTAPKDLSLRELRSTKDLEYRSFLQKQIEVQVCENCYVTFQSPDAYKNHIRSGIDCTKHFNLVCGYCKVFKATDKFELNVHLNEYHGDDMFWYICPYCSLFKTKDNEDYWVHVLRHKKTAELEQRIPLLNCSECSYTSRRRMNLQDHWKSHHDKNSPWHFCNHCDYKSKLKALLTTHMKQVHHILPFLEMCPNCTKKYRDEDKYHAHVASCTFESTADFKPKLPKPSQRKRTRSTGRKIKSDNDSSIPSINSTYYKCSLCGYASNDLSVLERHVEEPH